MQNDLFFEIGTEEIPAGYIMPALSQLENNITARLDTLALGFGKVQTVATPRRLAIHIENLDMRQEDKVEEMLGPPKQAAFDADGNPTKAATGFAKSRGVEISDLQVAKTDKGEYLMVKVEKKGQETLDLLATLLPEAVTALPFPKSMRWGSGQIHFARPIQWLTALYGKDTVSFTLDGTSSGNTTNGHRFMGENDIEVEDFANYLTKLGEANVMVDPAVRREAVREAVTQAAAKVGGTVLADEELLDTVSNLVEKPFAICGSFEERFLELPQEVLITSMREHQKYFAVVDKNGKLMPHFIAVNNTKVKDDVLGAEGHQRVLRARLEDAFFFFKEDQSHSLAERVENLSGVIFQHKLGTMLEKTDRMTSLAGILAVSLAPEQKETTQRGAHLAKSDLLTDMVGEFPSLQGVIGKDYAILNKESEEVALAICEHYLPVRAGSALPQSTPGALIGMADRLDTICGCFGIGQTPTGTTDPFGLRRQALGLLHIIMEKQFTVSLDTLVAESLALYEDKLSISNDEAKEQIIDFIKGRFCNDLTAQGVPVGAVEAATSVLFDDPLDCKKRIEALMAISKQEAFTLLAGSFKRVMNIIKDNSDTTIKEDLLESGAEQQLHATFEAVAKEAQPLLAGKNYKAALGAILKMKEPVDNFFDDVMVMVDDEAVRNNRLNLLTKIAQLFLEVGDFSKMYSLNQ